MPRDYTTRMIMTSSFGLDTFKRMKIMRTFSIAGVLVILLASGLALASPSAQQPPQPPPDQPPTTGEPVEQEQTGRGGAPAREPQPRPYDRVITRDAKS